MTTRLDLERMLASLEAQMEIHREKEAHHAREEEAHREQRAAHAAELAALARHYEALKSSAEAAAPLADRYDPTPPKQRLRETLPPGKPIVWSRLVERVLVDMATGEEVTPTSMAGPSTIASRASPIPPIPG
ncbi:MAG TPA: hypothetical protein VLE27_15845 [Thermoanaerobaculia bacterium]|nr:hypothetical protein [Thermoanaerobaculia bacterium]